MGLILSPLFYNLFLSITLPKTTLKAMVEKPLWSFLNGMLLFNPTILDFNSLFPPALENFLQSWRLWKTEIKHKQSQILKPDHLIFPPVDDAKKRSAFSQAGRCHLIVWFRNKIRETETSCRTRLNWVMKLGHFIFRNLEWKPGGARCVHACTHEHAHVRALCPCSHFSLVSDGKLSQTWALFTSFRP